MTCEGDCQKNPARLVLNVGRVDLLKSRRLSKRSKVSKSGRVGKNLRALPTPIAPTGAARG